MSGQLLICTIRDCKLDPSRAPEEFSSTHSFQVTIMDKKKMAPFFASLVLFFATAIYRSSVAPVSAFAQIPTPTWCGTYDGAFCTTETFCAVPGGLTGCLRWDIRPVYAHKTIQQCTVPGTTSGDDAQTDPSGDCAN